VPGLAIALISPTLGVLSQVSASAEPSCLGRPATLVSVDGDTQVHGTEKADVIVTGAGDDVVHGGGGNDRVCSSGGEDRVLGEVGRDLVDSGAGEDFVEGGNGSDEVEGGSGTDSLIGDRGNDSLSGGGGTDFLDGGLGDDALAGDAGALDQLIGDVGNDRLLGGPGDGDSLRGDQGKDRFDGGPGEHDVASFATARGLGGPGQGVLVDLGAGSALNDGQDTLVGIEDVVGSAFIDQIRGSASSFNNFYGGGGRDLLLAAGPGDVAFGGGGGAQCALLLPIQPDEPFASENACGEQPRNPAARIDVEIAGGPAASTLTAVFRDSEVPPRSYPVPVPPGAHLTLSYEPGAWIVREEPLPLTAGEGCVLLSASEARCELQAKPDVVFIDGGPGDDTIEVDPSAPASVSALIRGERGADVLVGGRGDDSLEGGTDGLAYGDALAGGGGDDALINGKVLQGGPGSDLLVARICAEEQIFGGAGIDSVSFARELPEGRTGYTLKATLGGEAFFTGPQPDGPFCPDAAAQIDGSVERIEGSRGDDVLIGDGGPNSLLGRHGNDVLLGAGGDDILIGGEESDRLSGEDGFDRLYGVDGLRDKGFSCGSGPGDEGIASTDPGDPAAANCRRRGGT